jgi:hypothetical protein
MASSDSSTFRGAVRKHVPIVRVSRGHLIDPPQLGSWSRAETRQHQERVDRDLVIEVDDAALERLAIGYSVMILVVLA